MLYGTFSPEHGQRAKDLQGWYEKLVERFGVVVGGSTPRARLRRIVLSLRPADAHCGFSDEASRNIHALLVGRRGLGQIGAGVIARARLAEALGSDMSALENATRSWFCWWIHIQRRVIDSGGVPESQGSILDIFSGEPHSPTVGTGPGPAGPGPSEPSSSGISTVDLETRAPTVLPPLELWPTERQLRWPEVPRGGINTMRMPLRECTDAHTFVDLQAAVQDELGPDAAAPNYLRKLLRLLRKLELLEEKEGSYITTPMGEQVLELGSPDTLIEALLVRVVGFAHLLRILAEAPAKKDALAPLLAVYVSGDGGEMLSTRLLQWGRLLGVVEKRSGGFRALTALGVQWAARLPQTLPSLEAEADPSHVEADAEDRDEEASTTPEAPTLAALFAALETDDQSRDFVFPRSLVRGLYAAWSFHERKRFVLFSGLSGTGKTQLLLHYARLTCTAMGLDPKEHLSLVPVRPDWRDPTGLLGYHNALHADPTFQIEPALALVLRAARNPSLPYFLILDEMNLARVERYFAPFLSAMESGEALQLHAEGREINGVPALVDWPANLRIGGTVNMDETTYPFSDKVLDRAFTFEFWEVDLPAFFARRAAEAAPTDGPTQEALLRMQALLTPVRRHIGYRAAGEVLGWVAASRSADPDADLKELIDEALFSKVLPRLRGSESPALSTALAEIQKECTFRGLPRCASKVGAMRTRLSETGVTSFWS